MQTETIILKGAQIGSGSSGVNRCVDIEVSGGIIEQIADNIDIPRGAVVVDCSSFFVSPGLVDVHVHLREPGQEAKETIASGTAAAARGGYTTVCAMPNLSPVPDSLEHLQVELDAIRRDARVRVLPYASITKGRAGRGEIVDMAALKPYVIGFSDDGCGVQSAGDMETAMQIAAQNDCKIVAHCEVESLLHGGYIHDGEYCRRHGHRGISSESEWSEVQRDCELAARAGCEYHVCHVSTKESVDIIRWAKEAGVRVTAETCPHYLLLTDDDLQEDGRFKMNPPLRTKDDQRALIEGLEDGTIDCIVTDHAPHTAEQKSRGLAGSAMGIVGLETAFPLLYTHFVRTGRWTLEFLIDKMSCTPRRVFHMEEMPDQVGHDGKWIVGHDGGVTVGHDVKGMVVDNGGVTVGQNGRGSLAHDSLVTSGSDRVSLKVGQTADLAVFDLGAHYNIDPETFLSKGRSTPFAGWPVYGRTVMTIVQGKIVYRYE